MVCLLGDCHPLLLGFLFCFQPRKHGERFAHSVVSGKRNSSDYRLASARYCASVVFFQLFCFRTFLSLLVFQQVLYWAGVGLIVQHFLEKRALIFNLSALVLVGFFPVIWFETASIWKDALMLSSLLFAVGVFLAARRKKTRYWMLTVSWVALILACGFRHNASMAVLPLVFMMTYDLLQSFTHLQKIAAASSLFLSIFLFARFVNDIGVVHHYPYLINQVVFWNLAGLSIDTEEILIPEAAFVNKDSAKIDVLKRYYSDASNNGLTFSSGIINPNIWEDDVLGRVILVSGLKTIAQHFKKYVIMRMRFLKIFSGQGEWMPHNPFIFKTDYWEGDENLGLRMYHMHHPIALSLLESKVATRFSHFGFYNVLPYLVCLVLAFFMLVVEIRRQPGQPDKLILLGMVISGLLYWLPYVLIAPSNDFRYHNWTMEVVLILIVVEGMTWLAVRFDKTDKNA